MKRLPHELKQQLDLLVQQQEIWLDNWVSTTPVKDAKSNYMEAKKSVLEFKQKYRKKGYYI